MVKNVIIATVNMISPGFSLLELQIYLGVMAILAVMICQVALMYHNLYDKIALSARYSVTMLSAIFYINDTFDHAIRNKKNNETFSTGLVFNKTKLTGLINSHQNVILDNVSYFTSSLDKQGTQIHGASFTCDYKTKRLNWYRAAFTKAFSCSSSL